MPIGEALHSLFHASTARHTFSTGSESTSCESAHHSPSSHHGVVSGLWCEVTCHVPRAVLQSSSGAMARPQLGRSGSRDRDLGGRLMRGSTDGVADVERRNVQDRMFALNLDRVASGAPHPGFLAPKPLSQHSIQVILGRTMSTRQMCRVMPVCSVLLASRRST